MCFSVEDVLVQLHGVVRILQEKQVLQRLRQEETFHPVRELCAVHGGRGGHAHVLVRRVAVRRPEFLLYALEHVPPPLTIFCVVCELVHVEPSLDGFRPQEVFPMLGRAQVHLHTAHIFGRQTRRLLVVHLPARLGDAARQPSVARSDLRVLPVRCAKCEPTDHEATQVLHRRSVPNDAISRPNVEITHIQEAIGTPLHHVLFEPHGRVVVHLPQRRVVLAADQPRLEQVLVEGITLAAHRRLPSIVSVVVRPQTVQSRASPHRLVESVHLTRIRGVSRHVRQVAHFQLHSARACECVGHCSVRAEGVGGDALLRDILIDATCEELGCVEEDLVRGQVVGGEETSKSADGRLESRPASHLLEASLQVGGDPLPGFLELGVEPHDPQRVQAVNHRDSVLELTVPASS
mmetsp:Transcript_61981/g.164717  ORF Transcript_61981/g.164717 Transcript_61981/m.164717 type:complete len:406 (+) Transcript_61981:205-1422(+)